MYMNPKKFDHPLQPANVEAKKHEKKKKTYIPSTLSNSPSSQTYPYEPVAAHRG